MSFWYKERQKIALWWNGISRQEIHSYVYTAVLFLFLTFLYFRFFTLFCGIKIITYKIGIEKEHYLLQNVSCLKLRTEVE